MGTVYSDIATIENSPTPSTLMDHGQVRGKVRHVSATYECASLATASVINICRLYKGDRVLLSSFIISDDLGSGNTLAVGDTDSVTAADPDRYLEATAAASAVVIQFNDATACIDKTPYEIQEDCWLTCTVVDECTGTIQFEIDIVENMS